MSPVRFACVSALVFAVLTINGCGGGGGAEPAPLAAPSKAFVADRGQATIGSSSNSNPGPGTVVADRRIVGLNTMLSANLIDLALDATNDRLYVADLRSILVFNNASTASGNVAPSRVVSSFAGLGNFAGIYLDTVNDRLYATVNFGLTNQVQVFDKVSTLSNAPPTRTFTFASNSLIDIAVDTSKNIAYVYNLDPTNLTRISVFDNVASLNSTVALTPNRTITIGESFSSGAALGMFIDPANDRLYAPRIGQVMVFDSASTRNGSVGTTAVPSRTITLPVPAYTNIFVELTANRLYAADNAGVNIIDNASTVSGTPAVTRVLAPGGSVFMAVVVKP